MRIPIPKPSPKKLLEAFERAREIGRWLLAAVANVAHAEYGTQMLNEAPIPEVAAKLLQIGPVHTWGQLINAAMVALAHAPYQICVAFWHSPIGGIAVIWWFVESFSLWGKLRKALKKKKAETVPAGADVAG